MAYENTSIEIKDVTFVKTAWVNPHSIVTFDVKDASGKVTQWIVEMGSPSAMSAVGWNRNSLTPGAVATVVVFPARNGTAHGRLARVMFPDGKTLNYREPRPAGGAQ
ncbi:MAG: hypothetical protein FJW14_12860 [Acidimicrobiia bacterium]|nr:hypothetical protein [Acidimicrobiia bacterium]